MLTYSVTQQGFKVIRDALTSQSINFSNDFLTIRYSAKEYPEYHSQCLTHFLSLHVLYLEVYPHNYLYTH